MATAKSMPDAARLRHLLDRALLELRLAGDLAVGCDDKSVAALIGGAKRNLRAALSRVVDRKKAEVES